MSESNIEMHQSVDDADPSIVDECDELLRSGSKNSRVSGPSGIRTPRTRRHLSRLLALSYEGSAASKGRASKTGERASSTYSYEKG